MLNIQGEGAEVFFLCIVIDHLISHCIHQYNMNRFEVIRNTHVDLVLPVGIKNQIVYHLISCTNNIASRLSIIFESWSRIYITIRIQVKFSAGIFLRGYNRNRKWDKYYGEYESFHRKMFSILVTYNIGPGGKHT